MLVKGIMFCGVVNCMLVRFDRLVCDVLLYLIMILIFLLLL